MNKEEINKIDDKLLFHYELNYVNNLKKQLTEANEKLEKIKEYCKEQISELNNCRNPVGETSFRNEQDIKEYEYILEIIKGK